MLNLQVGALQKFTMRIVEDTARRYAIPETQVRRYAPFISANMQDGEYDPGLAFNALLSCLTPETRALTIYSMRDSIAAQTGAIYGGLLSMLRDSGVSSGVWFPHESSIRQNLEHHPNTAMSGVLVDRGIVKVLDNGQHRRYMLTAAGKELALPLIEGAIKFVSAVSDMPGHRFDSMFRLLGTKMRQKTASRLVSCLVEEGPKSLLELQRRLQETLGKTDLNDLHREAATLEKAGAISKKSIMKREGNVGTVGLRYRLSSIAMLREPDEELAYEARAHDTHCRGMQHYLNMISFITRNPNSVYTTESMARLVTKHSGMQPEPAQILASTALRAFRLSGLLRAEWDLAGSSRTRLEASELSRMFYEMVLMPVKTAAFTLNPRALHVQPVTSEMICRFYNNYLEERPRRSA